MPFYLALKEIWRGRGRYILFSLVIALITMLVLFVAALAEGLGAGNREYIEKLNADLIVYQSNVDLSVGASRIGTGRLNELRRVDGVEAVGPIGTASASLVFTDDREPLNVALIGVEPGLPGEPPVFSGEGLRSRRANEVVIDRQVALRRHYRGRHCDGQVHPGHEEQFYNLRVIGISDNRQFSLQPSLIMPIRTWDAIRPQALIWRAPDAEIVANIVGVQVTDPAQAEAVARRIEAQVQALWRWIA